MMMALNVLIFSAKILKEISHGRLVSIVPSAKDIPVG
jgi:hypothetical protein